MEMTPKAVHYGDRALAGPKLGVIGAETGSRQRSPRHPAPGIHRQASRRQVGRQPPRQPMAGNQIGSCWGHVLWQLRQR
jgi:hypothetical protein